MPNITLDFSSVPSMEPVPPGNYPVVVEQVEVRDSQSSEFQYLNWELTISEGEYANRRLFYMTSLKPTALWRLRADLENLEIYQEIFTLDVDEDSGIILEPELAGRAAVAVVEEESYKGEPRSRPTKLLSRNGEDLARKKRRTSSRNGNEATVAPGDAKNDEPNTGETQRLDAGKRPRMALK